MGLHLEGASWDHEKCCLARSKPKVLVEELPIMTVVPIETSKLQLQVANILFTFLTVY